MSAATASAVPGSAGGKGGLGSVVGVGVVATGSELGVVEGTVPGFVATVLLVGGVGAVPDVPGFNATPLPLRTGGGSLETGPATDPEVPVVTELEVVVAVVDPGAAVVSVPLSPQARRATATRGASQRRSLNRPGIEVPYSSNVWSGFGFCSSNV